MYYSEAPLNAMFGVHRYALCLNCVIKRKFYKGIIGK